MTRHLFLVFCILAFAQLALSQSSSDDSSDDNDPDDLRPRRSRPDRDGRRRSVDAVREDDQRVELRSFQAAGAFRNEWRTRIRFEDDRLEVRLQYKQRVNSTETELSFRVRVDRQVYFNESGATPGYQANQDSPSTMMDFPNEAWNPVTVSPRDSNGVVTVSASTVSGRWAFEGLIGEVPFDVEFAGQNITVYPNTLKFTLEGTGISFPMGQDHLAFRTKIEYETGLEVDDNDGDDNDGSDDGAASSGDDSSSSSVDDDIVSEREVAVGRLSDLSAVYGVFEFLPKVIVDDSESSTRLIPTRSLGCTVETGGSASGSSDDSSDDSSDNSDGDDCAELFLTVDAVGYSSLTWDPQVGVATGVFDPTTGNNVARTSTTSGSAASFVVSLATTCALAVSSLVAMRALA